MNSVLTPAILPGERQLDTNGHRRFSGARKSQGLSELGLAPDVALAMKTNVAVMMCLREQIAALEQAILSRVRLRKSYKGLLSVDGIGKVLAITIMLETGDIKRFKGVGNYVSYCRCVRSLRISNKKVKGSGNAKCQRSVKTGHLGSLQNRPC